MKRCPGCGTFYDDDAQKFCEVDGLTLDLVPGGEEKVDPFLGTVVDGRYLVESVLGKGGMGAVYKARQTSVGRDIALKVILGETTEDLRGRFMLEAKLTSSLQSVHTVTIFDFGVFEDMLYLAMEYLQGKSLDDVLDEVDHLPWRKALKIVGSIAESLEEAHAKGIIHRDLKPANIHLAKMGSETEFVKVLDFGVAKFIADESHAGLTGTGMIVGTPNYMSPEQARARPLDTRSDLYALGIMLYEMLTGVPPFTGEATVDVLLKHVTELPPPICEDDLAGPLPAGLRGFVLTLLEKDPDERPQSARAVRDAIKTFLEGGTLEHLYPDPMPGDTGPRLPPLSERRFITGEESTLSATAMNTALARAAIVATGGDELDKAPPRAQPQGPGHRPRHCGAGGRWRRLRFRRRLGPARRDADLHGAGLEGSRAGHQGRGPRAHGREGQDAGPQAGRRGSEAGPQVPETDHPERAARRHGFPSERSSGRDAADH